MAGYPPPSPPFGFNAKQQARFARQQIKAQAQAQKAAFRAQRDFYRMQTRAMRRSSILGPLLVVAAGVMVLLVRIGRIPFTGFWTWYSRWWPLLLVGAGVVLIAEWGIDQMAAVEGQPYPARRFGGGVATLLVLLAASGAFAHGFENHRDFMTHSFGIDSDVFDHLFGEKHEMTQPLEADFPAGASLSIDNPHGDVTIVGKSGDDKVHITVNKQVYSESDSEADSKAQRISPNIVLTGSILSVSVPSLDGATADLTLTVPDFAVTSVTANHGDVNVSGIHAPVSVTANHGDIEVNSITGAVSARINNRNSSVTMHDITGDLTLRGHADDVNVSDVSGQVLLEGEFYGDTHLERLHGDSSFHTSRTQFAFARLDGSVDISPHADLSGNQIAGPVVLKTRSRNITLDRVAGDVQVSNSDGSVDVVSALPLGNISIENKSGEVNVTVPEHAGFTLFAQTTGGSIESDLELKPNNSDHVSVVQGKVGAGGPSVTIHTTHLDIGLHQRDAAPLAPAPPKVPDDPAKPRV
jgi:DUF4097 and DUF4098 domain-containing protein YvlB